MEANNSSITSSCRRWTHICKIQMANAWRMLLFLYVKQLRGFPKNLD